MKLGLVLAAATTAAAFPMAEPEQVYPRQHAESIHAAMVAKGKLYFGTATDQNRLTAGSNAAIVKANFGQVTPENSMKWESVQRSKGQFSFATADYLTKFAAENNQIVRGHTTVWHSQLPQWVSQINNKQTLTDVIRTHIQTVMGRWKGQIYAWDVLNEIFAENGGFRSSVFYNVLGEDFVRISFEIAREVDPACKLYINDYNLDQASYAKTQAMARKVKEWIGKGWQIDGIGSQGHLTQGQGANAPGAMALLCAAAPECALTEVDIQNASAADWQNVVKACMQQQNCVGITVWGVRDNDSWRPQGNPLLFDSNYRAKNHYSTVLAAIKAS